jgi:hypothetical protein
VSPSQLDSQPSQQTTHTNAQILDNVEIQHRILENVPALKAVSGFSEVHGRKLGDQEVSKREGRERGFAD